MAVAPGYSYAGQPASGGGGFWSDVGFNVSAGMTAYAITNAYYQIEAQKGQLKAQASSLDHQASMARINARQAESDAQAILRAGSDQKAALTLGQGQERAGLIAGQGASGTAIGGAGSNAEVRASQRLIQRIDAMTLDSNTIRAANAARTRGVNASNEALLSGVSARNVRGTADSLNPWVGAGTAALGSTGLLASQWTYRQRYRGGR
jgi:hypothetical protein